MARYQENFRLNTRDIDLIEQALRREIARCARHHGDPASGTELRGEVQALNALLGKIHNQKVFFAQVNAVGVPAG